ncbi:LysR family transcriptional regulator [Methylobacterium sp. 2A]|jgi:DNA-binding transcriptional LysR family regulator|uniref:LysR family transcriptional regulator n=1 Tax=Methylobacterium sp. 2A TaxID=2603816 RepID=UPI001353A6F3|nr:LysR family transcriptional regulator [Methylobacterium sp. 2A]MWV21374.1 LysR family transcriptional regulator [Methylobacterium sp. 2A]
MLDWQDIHYFAVLAQAGSLSAAARALGVDHVTVGRRVAALEQALALPLVERLPRRTTLTREGAAVAALADEMAGTVQAIARRARGYADAAKATVRISAPPAVAARLIAPQVARFRQAHPGITLVLSGLSRMAALDRGEAEIAVRLTRPEDPDLVIRRIGVMRFALYATPEQAARPPEDWTFIGYDAALDHVVQQAWLRSLLDGRPIVFQASDLFGQQEAARAGLGAAVLPCFMGDGDPALVRLATGLTPPTRAIWLATYPDLKRAPGIRAALAFLAAAIGQGCPSGPS